MAIDSFEVTIIGAGAIGLAAASALASTGRRVLIVESNRSFGQETSSRNSEVIHAGIYHPPGFLKTSLCVSGNRLLYAFCEKHDIPHRRVGKIIVAMDDNEIETLEDLKIQGESNGVEGLDLIGKKSISEMEPDIRAEAGLFSPSSGILDSHRFMGCLHRSAEEHSAVFAFHAEVTAIGFNGRIYDLDINSGEYSVRSKYVINCAGLHADRIAALLGMDIDQMGYRLRPCKGTYFVSSSSPGLRHLVYPVPHKNKEYLGIHATLDLGGRVRFGPDIQYLDEERSTSGKPPYRLLDYDVDEGRRRDFFYAIQKYLPGISEDALHADMSGIRPKLQGPGEPIRDFVIRQEGKYGYPGLINLIGIDSPGLTCSLSIARMVSSLVNEVT